MSDQPAVVAALAAAAARGEPVVLASVVRVVGAAYRGVGARMLVRADGSTVGMVSAGCLEADLVLHAARARTDGAPTVATYNNDADADLVWGLGLGCDGLVEVLLEPLAPARAASLAVLLTRALADDAPVRLATVVRAPATATAVGARLLVTSDGVWDDGVWGDGALRARVLRAVREWTGPAGPLALDGAEDGTADHGTADHGTAHDGAFVSVESVVPPVRLVVCGSGPDAAPVVRLAAGLGWDVTVVAPRLTGQAVRFPGARAAECEVPERLAAAVPLGPRTSAVVMSHDYARDRAYLGALLDSGVGYVGVMGPRRRTERMLADLADAGRAYDAVALRRLHAPVGLDIGGDGPDAIALAIVAEVSAVASGRAGGPLRERRAPIHAAAHSQDASVDSRVPAER